MPGYPHEFEKIGENEKIKLIILKTEIRQKTNLGPGRGCWFRLRFLLQHVHDLGEDGGGSLLFNQNYQMPYAFGMMRMQRMH